MGAWLKIALPYALEAARDLFVPPENDTPAKVRGRLLFIFVGLLLSLSFFFGEKVFTLSTEKHVLQMETDTLKAKNKQLEETIAGLKAQSATKPKRDQNPAPYDSNQSSRKQAVRRESVDDHDLMIDHITFN